MINLLMSARRLLGNSWRGKSNLQPLDPGYQESRLRVESLENRSLMAVDMIHPELPLVYDTDMQYIGAFRVPVGLHGNSAFTYGGDGMAFNPANNSLFTLGNVYQQSVAEITIPEPVISANKNDLPIATFLQPFTDVTSRVPNWTLVPPEPQGGRVGDLLVADGQLIVSAYEYYDAAGDAVGSHFKLDSLNLATANATGLFDVGTLGGGVVGGYMTHVPEEWQDALGARFMTGLSSISILFRTSVGPAAFGFDPSDFGSTPAPAEKYLYYPMDHPLDAWDFQSDLFNATTHFSDYVFIPGTRTVLYLASHGTGDVCYGLAVDCNDPIRTGKGYHSVGGDYVYRAYAYDAEDFYDVKNGTKQSWELRPYAHWDLNFPIETLIKNLGSAAFDPTTGRLYVMQLYADVVGYAENPIVEVFQIGTPSVAAIVDTATITEDAANNTVTGNVLTNDRSPSNAPLSVSKVNDSVGSVGARILGEYGDIRINSNGSFTYYLDNSNSAVNNLFSGQTLRDTFAYTTTDGSTASSSTVTVTIQGATDISPTASRDDLVFLANNQWKIAKSNGTTFEVSNAGFWSNGVTWDNMLQGDFNGDSHQDRIGRANGTWWVARSNGQAFVNENWGTWSKQVNWNDVSVADVNGDGKDDLVGRANGRWWVAKSTGSGFVNEAWGAWSNQVPWNDVRVADVNGDNKDDIVGRTNGRWWVAKSTGTTFVNEAWGAWSNQVAWNDVSVADIDDDGRDDLLGRTAGQWWVARSNGTGFANEFWGAWSNQVTWDSVRIGDFNGDGRDDVIGRTGREWWVASSTGSAFQSRQYGVANAAWTDLAIGDFDGDGRDDVAGRVEDKWWVARADVAAAVLAMWYDDPNGESNWRNCGSGEFL